MEDHYIISIWRVLAAGVDFQGATLAHNEHFASVRIVEPSENKAVEKYLEFARRFPAAEGWGHSLTKWEGRGREIMRTLAPTKEPTS